MSAATTSTNNMNMNMNNNTFSMPRTLVLGATGATGSHVVKFLLQAKKPVRVIVRDKDKFSNILKKFVSSDEIGGDSPISSGLLEVVEQQQPFSSMTKSQLASALAGCGTVTSCLGHNMTLSGIWIHDRTLCTDAVKIFTGAAIENKHKIKFILMNTVGAYNTNLQEDKTASWGFAIGVNILKWVVPPHWDNMCAIEHLVDKIGNKNPFVDWVVVRPDSLLDEDKPSPVQAFPSPLSNPLYNPGSISRVSVARFMADLDLEEILFSRFRFQSPAIYNTLPKGVTKK